jgi:hypothetical protein
MVLIVLAADIKATRVLAMLSRLRPMSGIVTDLDVAPEDESESETQSPVSSPPLSPQHLANIEDLVKVNAMKFAGKFIQRLASTADLPDLAHTKKDSDWIAIAASALRYYFFLMPDLYCNGGLIRPATNLEDFKNICIAAREGDSPEATDAYLAKVLPLAEDFFREYEHNMNSECALGTWLDSVIHSCAIMNSEYPRRGCQTKKAVGGALPFTNMGETETYLVNNFVGTDKIKQRINS